nr:baseplate J/gp47 family protein [uncultured Lichenicoccus sp.]
MSGIISTNVPTPTFGATGFVGPAESVILAGVQADLAAAFGASLNPALNTPQGQLATSLSAIIADCNANFQLITNLVDPAFSYGRFQDAVGRIYFITRNPATSTVVQATCTALSGVTIPTGALAQDQAGNLYTCTAGGTVPQGAGTIVLPFACQTTGPIACPIGYLNTIYQTIPNWNAITNTTAGVLGNVVESRSAFETRRQQSVEQNAQGTIQSILGAVLSVSGVLDAYVTQNPTGTAVSSGGQTIGANSVYVCVSGGAAAAVAQAIFTKIGPGANTTGNTTVTVTDTSYSYPQPSYAINFQTPASLPILFAVTITNGTSVPSNALALIQAAIALAFAGGDGGSRARIGSMLYASRYYAVIAALGPWAQVVSILIGTSSANAYEVLCPINQIPTFSPSNVSLILM